MDNIGVIVIFGVLGIAAVIIGVAMFGGILFANDSYAADDGMIIDVRENEITQPDGSTSGGNATVVVMDDWHMFLASIGGIPIAFLILVWAVMALAMVASLAGFTK
jgi:hypothetical protein